MLEVFPAIRFLNEWLRRLKEGACYQGHAEGITCNRFWGKADRLYGEILSARSLASEKLLLYWLRR